MSGAMGDEALSQKSQMDLGDFARRIAKSPQEATLKAAAEQLLKTTRARSAKFHSLLHGGRRGLFPPHVSPLHRPPPRCLSLRLCRARRPAGTTR